MFSSKFIVFSWKFIMFSSKFIVFSLKFILFSSKFIVFSLKFIMFYSKYCSDSGEHFTTIQNWQVYLCSTQENTLRLPKNCKSTSVLRRTLYTYSIYASLLMFYSGEHLTTIQYLQVCLCSLLRITLYSYPISASLLIFYSGEHFITTQYLLSVCVL